MVGVLRSAATMAMLALVLAPLAQAGWSVPEGEPYEAGTAFVDERPAMRDHLVFRDGLLAGLEHPWGGNHEWQGAPFAWRWDGDGFQQVLGSLDGGTNASASAIAAGHGHVAWRADLSPDHFQAESLILLQDLGSGAPAARVSGPAYHSPPVINGPWLTFASRPGGLVDQAVPATLHRVHLGTGLHEAWPHPGGACEPWVAAVGAELAYTGAGVSCYRDEDGGLALWLPGSPAPRPLTADPDPALMQAEGARLLWTAYREGEGRGTNVYLADAVAGTEERVSASPGRECCASLSGGLVAWLDLRSESAERRDVLPYSIYFKDLVTRNEYQVQGTLSPTGGPALDGRVLAFNDAEGRLVSLQLPAPADLLQVQPEATLEDAAEAADGAVQLVVDLVDPVANVTVEVAWDLDGDGEFETQGPVTVEAEAKGTLLGRAVDSLGRVAVLAVQVSDLVPAARAAGDEGARGDGTGAAPIPGPAAPLAALLVAALAAADRSRRR